MAIADNFHMPEIPVEVPTKPVVVHTEHGDFYLSSNNTMEDNKPISDFVLITDLDDGRVFWVNKYSIVWIGPR